GKPALDDALVPGQRRQGLERRRAERDWLALGVDEDVRAPRLLRRRYPRRMIAGEVGDVALRRALPERRAIRSVGGPERRADLGERAPTPPLPFGGGEGLRARLAPHPPAPRPRAPGALAPPSPCEGDARH